MTNLNSLKIEVKKLKVKQRAKKPKLAFKIWDEYLEGTLSYDEAIDLLDSQEWGFGDFVRMLIECDKKYNGTKKE